MRKLGIYIHIPYCERKCGYCDFLSFAGSTRESRDRYRDAVWNELKWWAKTYGKAQYREAPYSVDAEYEVDTIFIGGGTPSVMESWSLWRLVLVVKDLFNCSDKLEITAEANPNSLDVDKMSVWGVFGVNRLSFGVQSFDDGVLETLGRLHTAAEAEERFRTARKYFYKNISIDLMFGIPGQTIDSWRETLDRAIALGPDHISFYSLQLEEGTPIYNKVKSGALAPVSDETDRAMYHLAVEKLTAAGYVHYEISNAAKPGFESRHNLKYWSMDEYLGVGLGAASYMKAAPYHPFVAKGAERCDCGPDCISCAGDGTVRDEVARKRIERYGVRFCNITDYAVYLEGDDPVDPASVHVNNLEDYVSEFFFTGLRKIAGVRLADLEAATGKPAGELKTPDGEPVETVIDRHVSDGLLERKGDTVRLTAKGLDLANTVLRDFV
ncbi:MAG: radical SAM family heme chaperone HemW [Firmicutes bacterium]|nr:radical SAM family heme chaperone HemW [Bacillota bacterium]